MHDLLLYTIFIIPFNIMIDYIDAWLIVYYFEWPNTCVELLLIIGSIISSYRQWLQRRIPILWEIFRLRNSFSISPLVRYPHIQLTHRYESLSFFFFRRCSHLERWGDSVWLVECNWVWLVGCDSVWLLSDKKYVCYSSSHFLTSMVTSLDLSRFFSS